MKLDGGALGDAVRNGLEVIRSHKLRSALTVLSITIGTFSIVAMSSLARSTSATLARGIEEVGGGTMVVFFLRPPDETDLKRANYTAGLTLADATVLRQRLPHIRHVEVHMDLGDMETQAGEVTFDRSDGVAAGADFLSTFSIKLLAGRPIDATDVAGAGRVAVLGNEVATSLFGDPTLGLGKRIRMDGTSYTVIGVAAEARRFGVRFGFHWNRFVQIPLSLAADRPVTTIVLRTEGATWNESTARLATAIIRARHNEVNDFDVRDFSIVVERFHEVMAIMRLVVGVIASIALLVGGVGVMNILLVSVNERIREIGIRKAVGASASAIRWQFLIESALLSGLGGAFGAAGGAAMAVAAGLVIKRQQEIWVTVIGLEAFVLAVGAAVGVGLLFGLVPAWRAGRLGVVECLNAGL